MEPHLRGKEMQELLEPTAGRRRSPPTAPPPRLRRRSLAAMFGVLALATLCVVTLTGSVHAAPATVSPQSAIDVTPAKPTLTAVDPMAWGMYGDVLPARPFLYSVDNTGITITRFNDNKVVGRWPWPTDVIYTILPDGSFKGLAPPVWKPVAMTVSAPTDAEIANRVKEIPDLTPPSTFVYVVMAHSGYKWSGSVSNGRNLRDAIVLTTDPSIESAMLIQIDVSDPSFSTSRDPVAPSGPHIAAAILGHGAGQPVYDRKTGNVYVGNMPSTSLPAGLQEFVSVIRRIPPEVTAKEAEIPGISKPVIRCGPQHPESGIPVGRPQAYACYDPSGEHPIDDNEHVGAAGEFEWEFRNLPIWLTAHKGVKGVDGVTRGSDGILYGTPPTVGEWFAEARVHNLEDPYGVFSDWHPIQLLVTPTAGYLPIKAQFAAGVPVAYPLEGTGSCALSGAPAWIEVAAVDNGCVVMGTAPLDGEYYNFTMPGFEVAGYPGLSLVFSGNVFGEYGFVPLPAGVGISGMAWHQVSKEADPSTETPVLSIEFIGVDPNSGQLWRILAPPGQPQPPNVRPPETALTLDVVSAEGSALVGSGFGEVAVEADRDIYVAAANAVIKVSGGTVSSIALDFTPSSLSLVSDLRTAIPGVEPGQSDNNALWAAGKDKAVLINTGTDTDPPALAQWFGVSGASSVSADFRTRYAYVANGTPSIAVFGPGPRPSMAPRIWSSEEITWNRGFASIATKPFEVMATGDPVPTLSLLGDLPVGLKFVDNGDGTATVSGIPAVEGEYAFALTATNTYGTYAQAFGMAVNSPPTIDSAPQATFYVGASSSFTIFGTGLPTPIFYTWDEAALAAAGVQLVDNENGTASLVGTPTTPGTYKFLLKATTGCPVYVGPAYIPGKEPDATQTFTLTVIEGSGPPVITSGNTATWAAAGAPFSPDPFTVTSIGKPTPTLSVTACSSVPEGLCTSENLPAGVTFIDNHDSTAIFGAACVEVWPGIAPSCIGLLEEGTQGTYTLTIRASNSTGNTIQTFTLVLERNDSLLGADPTTLSLATDGTFVPVADVILTTGGDTLPYALVTTADWLHATPEFGMMPGKITVSADAAGLAPGTYTGTVIVGSAGTEGPFASIAVTLGVVGSLGPGMVGIFPSTLNFNYNVNAGTLTPTQTVWVMSGGQALNYTVSTNGAKWLSAPASGTSPGGFHVSVDPKVGVGMHIAELTIDAGGALNGPQSIPVTLVKTAGDSDLIQVMFDVGGGPEGIAVDRLTHNLFISSSNAAAEAAAASGSETEMPTTGPPEPSLVYHVNPVEKTVSAQIVVHSEGEYIGFNSTTGFAYHASQGTGEVAVINGDKNEVVAFIPLWLDKEPYQPYQVAIDEAQNIIYVGAKSPEPEPNALNGPPYGCKAIRELPSDEVPKGKEPEFDCWHAGAVFVIDGYTNKIVSHFMAGDDPEGVVFAAATGKVYASNEDDGNVTVAQGAVRNSDGSISGPKVLGTIIKGKLEKVWWQPNCDGNNNCGSREVEKAWLWPEPSACHGIDDEAEEADKMTVDPNGNVYITDDRYRVAKIDGATDKVVEVIAISGYDCERTVPDGTSVVFRNTANNIAYMPLGQGKLYVVSEQNTVTLVEWRKQGRRTVTEQTTITLPKAAELDAITTDPALNHVYITDEAQASLWILKGACANGVGVRCTR